jgi:hypothetical protein
VTADPGERALQQRTSQLEQIARRSARAGKTPERVELERIAVESAADARAALRYYRDRGEEAAAGERSYRKLQLQVSELLAHQKANGQDRLPAADWPGWQGLPLLDGAELADTWVGDLRTAKAFEVALNAIAADARYVRDTTLHRSRSAGKALTMFDRIINLMQSLMRQEALDERTSQNDPAAQLGWDDDEEEGP